MLRVGLTGGIGSGKSTVAALLRTLGASVLSADELGREMMQPGHAIFAEVVRVFGPEILHPDGTLNRTKLAEQAFQHGRLQELNAIVHPAVIAAQTDWLASIQTPIAVVESALIFEVERDARLRGESGTVLANWRNRFDRIVLVTAPDAVKIAHYVARVCPPQSPEQAAADARARLAQQMPDAEKLPRADFVLENTGTLEDLRHATESLWHQLSNLAPKSGSVTSVQ